MGQRTQVRVVAHVLCGLQFPILTTIPEDLMPSSSCAHPTCSWHTYTGICKHKFKIFCVYLHICRSPESKRVSDHLTRWRKRWLWATLCGCWKLNSSTCSDNFGVTVSLKTGMVCIFILIPGRCEIQSCFRLSQQLIIFASRSSRGMTLPATDSVCRLCDVRNSGGV